jgi:putative ABC transport system permease protein
VGNANLSALSIEVAPIYYFPYKQLPWQPPPVILRTAVPPRMLETAIRKQVAALDSQVPVFEVRTMDDLLSTEITPLLFLMLLLGGFAGIALLLTMVGLYGVMTYTVARRTREIGVRVALGASRSAVLSMVLKQAVVLVLAGLLLGLAGAFAGGQLLRSMLFGVSPLNPVVLGLACCLIALTGAIAAYLPARRASKVDPMVALRYE